MGALAEFAQPQADVAIPPAIDSSEPLHYPAFRSFFVARMASTAATQMLAVAVGWQIYAITHSALALGLVGLAQFVPIVVLALPIGHVADRYDRRRIARICQWMMAVCSAVLAIETATGRITPALIYFVVVIAGAARAGEHPTLQALSPQLVPQPIIPSMLARTASAAQTATIVGPAIGGFLYAAGPNVVYGSVAALYAAAGLLIGMIRVLREAPPLSQDAGARSIFAGLRFIRGNSLVLGSISLDLFAVLLGGATALLPIFARDILMTGPWGLGLLQASQAVGALASSLIAGRFNWTKNVGPTLFGTVIAYGAATIAFGLSRNFILSMLLLATLGATNFVSAVIRQSLVQIQTPDDLRGRVTAVNSLFAGTANQLGAFESGATAALFGAVPSVLIGGIGTILVVLTWMKLFPGITRMRTFQG